MTNPIAHFGGACSHGGAVTSAEGTVLAGSIPVARKGDAAVCGVHGPVEIASASRTVLVGGVPAARMGDLCKCPGAGGQAGAGVPPTVGPPTSLEGFGVDLPDGVEAKRVDLNGDGVMDATQLDVAQNHVATRGRVTKGGITVEAEADYRRAGGSAVVSDAADGSGSLTSEAAGHRGRIGTYVRVGDRDVFAAQLVGRKDALELKGALVNGPLGLGGALEGKVVRLDVVGGVALIDPTNSGNWVRIRSTAAGAQAGGHVARVFGGDGSRTGFELGAGGKAEVIVGELDLAVSSAVFGPNGFIPVSKKTVEWLFSSVAGEDVAKKIASATVERTVKAGAGLGEAGTPFAGRVGAMFDHELDRAEVHIDGFFGQGIDGLAGLRGSVGPGQDPFTRFVPDAPTAEAADAEVDAASAPSLDMGPNVLLDGVMTVLVGS